MMTLCDPDWIRTNDLPDFQCGMLYHFLEVTQHKKSHHKS